MSESVVERLRNAEIVRPDPWSATKFAPFIYLDPADRDALLAMVEELRERLREIEESENYELIRLREHEKELQRAFDWLLEHPYAAEYAHQALEAAQQEGE